MKTKNVLRVGDKVRINNLFPLRRFNSQTGIIEAIEIFKTSKPPNHLRSLLKVRFDTPVDNPFGRAVNFHWFSPEFVEEVG